MIGNKKVFAYQIILHVILAFLLVLMLYPLAMALWNAFKSDIAYDATKWYPTLPLRVGNITSAVKIVGDYIINTLIVAVAGPLGQLLIASLAAYAFAKIDMPFKKILFGMVLLLVMIPGVLTLVPQYLLYRSLNLYNNLLALILPQWTGGCVFGVFLLNSFFSGLPNDIFESARIDGAKEYQCFFIIALPLCIPILATLFIMTVVNIWNDYLWPRIMLAEENYTISAGLLLAFQSEYTSNMPVMFAGYLVASSPLILFFIFANKFYIQGLVSTSIKM